MKNIFLVRNWLLSLFFFLIYWPLQAQTADSTVPEVPKTVIHKPLQQRVGADSGRPAARTIPVKRDSTHRATVQAAVPKPDSVNVPKDTAMLADSLAKATPKVLPPSDFDIYLQKLASTNDFLKPGRNRFVDTNPERPYRDIDWLIYLIAGVVLLLSIIRLSYRKYFADLFRAFLNPTLSQRQLKDQLSQSPFPNFLLNAFFAISLGLYLYLVLFNLQIFPQAEPWLLIPGLILLVVIIYLVKYIVLRFCGWLFGNSELADAYIFILFLINKVLGILLVPFLVIMAFCKPQIANTFLYISLFFIALLVVYRYIRSYSLVKQYLSFSKLHFFLYLCAFEVAPVLILIKVLQNIWLTGNP
ncbi:DUF4271 domain-containing protein [Chitinophaga silvatica]|uniref:DUF4271 domain-containing protein n=1 Tax=Chitinophaga silvatica TaxID=2282649 RepID=A0A3E1Y9L6_9BACT|nr:DUF4271 domain-containing protein [Chitinophaga silvatica]RFS22434.1 DUF4271 domain-containing protein [Chitinophaga silvatica]